MEINGKLRAFNAAKPVQKNVMNKKDTPAFGIIKPETDMMIKLIPDIEEHIGKDVLPFIREQQGIILSHKVTPEPQFVLNWAEQKYVPFRNISHDVYNAGGFKFKIPTGDSGPNAMTEFKNFLDLSLVMVVYSIESTVRALESFGKDQRQKALCDILKKTAKKIIESCPPEKYEFIKANFQKMAKPMRRLDKPGAKHRFN